MDIDIVLGPALGRGGVETTVTVIANKLVEQGNRVRIFQAYPSLYPEWLASLPNIQFFGPLDQGPNRNFKQEAERLRSLFDCQGYPDIVVATHTPFPVLHSFLALTHLEERRPPIISWLHSPADCYEAAEALQLADAHLAISRRVGESIRRYVPPDQPIFYVGNPVVLDGVSPIPRTEGDVLNFLYIGRLDIGDKRVDLLFSALALVRGDFHLHVIGDGFSRHSLMALASAKGIQSKITWYGWLRDPWTVVSSADLLILPSAYEGFGMVLVEALARGVPLVASKTEGPEEIVTEDVGWLFPPGDVLSLAKILQGIVSRELPLPSPETCMASAMRYDVDRVLERFTGALRTVVKQRKGIVM
ncbi:glycosyltransferase [Alicyclobacillus sendaiensis]|uniref:glycosyltransferase n=1 Tax=Alicyclobacillus sendaiensis TaxID=192387 RepID=UPI0034CED13E